MNNARNNISNDIQGHTRTHFTVLRRFALCSFALVALAVVAMAQTQQVPARDPGRSLHAQQTRQITHPAQPTDPSGYSQRPSVEDAMRHAVNPCNRDYGRILYGWQDTVVQYTIANWVWWFGVITVLCLLAALGYIWWYTELWQARQDCFVRAAAVLIGQRNTAYQRARFAINKHNELVDRYDLLFIKFNEAERSRQAAEAIDDGSESAQSLFPDDAGDATPVVEANAPVVEVQGGTLRADQVVEINGSEYVQAEDHLRRIRSLENRIKNLRATKQQLADRLAEFEGTN
jgi:hypothetical protein